LDELNLPKFLRHSAACVWHSPASYSLVGVLTDVLGMVVNVYLSPVSQTSLAGRQLIRTPRGTGKVL
jgi:hypothetical protein